MKSTDEIDILECRVRGLENEVRQLRETLRDKFAAATLNGLISHWGGGAENLLAEKAFRIADMVLEARKK
jgi:hypothetical protein